MLSKKTLTKLIGSTVITGALIFAVFHEQGLAEFSTILYGADRRYVLSYVLISLLALVLRAFRYQLALRHAAGAEHVPSFPGMLMVTAIRNGLVDLLPARLGELSFFYVCSRLGVAFVSAAGVFGVCFALDIIVLFGIFALLLIEANFTSTGTAVFENAASSILPLICAVFVLTGVLSFLLLRLDKIARFVSRLLERGAPSIPVPRLQAAVRALAQLGLKLADELAHLRSSGTYWKLAALTAILRAAKYGSLYLLLVAVTAPLGVPHGAVSPLLSSTAFIAAEASASLPISGIMGFGTYEAAWTLIFSISKVEIPSITSVIFAVHLITQIVAYSVTALALAAFLAREWLARE